MECPVSDLPCRAFFLLSKINWYNIGMEIDMNENSWATPCPKYDCKKTACKCGLEYVNIPASLGDDSEGSNVAPKNGAYCNALVIYEANNHVYIYSKEGVPTLIDVDASDISTLEQEVIKAQKDVHELREDIDDFIYGFDTVAQMKVATNLGTGDLVQTYGFHVNGDGGGAKYTVREIRVGEAADEMTIIGLAGGILVAELNLNGEVHTKQFGAYGDSFYGDIGHDDTIALQAAIDYCGQRDYGVLYVDSGRYKISDSLKISKTIKIKGQFEFGKTNEGPIYGSELKQSTSGKAIFELVATTYGCEFVGLRITGTNDNTCIGFKSSSGILLEEYIIDRIHFSVGLGKGIDLNNSGIGVISNCSFSYCGTALEFQRAYSTQILYNNFYNNDIDMFLHSLDSCTFDGNWLETTSSKPDGVGILFQAPCIARWTYFMNNTFLIDGVGIMFDGTTNITERMSFNGLLFANSRHTGSKPVVVDMKNGSGVTNQNPNNGFRITFENCVFDNVTSGQAIDIDNDYLGRSGWRVIDCKAWTDYSGGDTNMFTPGQPNTAVTSSHAAGFSTNGIIQFSPIVNMAVRENNALWMDSIHRLYMRDNNGIDNKIMTSQNGTTADRPTSNIRGDIYYDTTINKPIWWNGSNWVDATGAVV